MEVDETSKVSPMKLYATLFGILILGCGMWYAFKPIKIGSPIFWVGFVLILAPVWLFLESLGEVVFSSKLGSKFSRPMRIIYGVIVLLVIWAVVSILKNLFIAVFGLY